MNGESDETVSFDNWLQGTLSENRDKRYRHRRLDEVRELREKIWPRLKKSVLEAHEDARRSLENPLKISLDRLPNPHKLTIAEMYPAQLPTSTLMGYFGEVFSGIICENLVPLGENRWQVPAYLFRFHTRAFRYLEKKRQGNVEEDPKKDQIRGREGDDCLAFVLDENGNIIRSLVCEAKCLHEHDKRKVAQAHEQLSKPDIVPQDRPNLIAVLKNRDDAEALRWREALYKLEFEVDPRYERCDLVCYIYGNRPRSGSRIDPNSHHEGYAGGRRLEAVEIYISGIRQLVRKIYGKEDDERDE